LSGLTVFLQTRLTLRSVVLLSVKENRVRPKPSNNPLALILLCHIAVSGLRTQLLDAIPPVLKIATMTGIGLFLAIIGFENAKLTVDHPATLVTLVTLGSLRDPSVFMSLPGILLIGTMMIQQVKGAILVGILAITALAGSTHGPLLVSFRTRLRHLGCARRRTAAAAGPPLYATRSNANSRTV
jgi:hypothetical protein